MGHFLLIMTFLLGNKRNVSHSKEGGFLESASFMVLSKFCNSRCGCAGKCLCILVIGAGKVSCDTNPVWDLSRLLSLFYFPFCFFEHFSSLFWAHFCNLPLSLPTFKSFLFAVNNKSPHYNTILFFSLCAFTMAVIAITHPR